MKHRKCRRNSWRRGFVLVEVLVAIIILGATLLSLSAASALAYRQISYGLRDADWSAAVQQQLEELTGDGYRNVTSGSGAIYGYPMTWTVTGTDPKTVTLEVTRTLRSGQVVVVDTLLLILPAADTL